MIEFTKMHGLGNDYVYIDCTENNIDNESTLARFVSNRNFGIGSDGLILICKSNIADFKMRMFNSDGTEAEMCGNGIRCVAKFVYDKGLTNKKEITVETLAGIKKLILYIKDNKVHKVKVDMGEPVLDPKKIPVNFEGERAVNLPVKILDKEFFITCVSMGNPHAVIIVENINNIDIEKYGRLLETNEIFPKKANIEFVQIVDEKNIKMRVWERGAGETLACGTGASAVCVACCIKELTNREVNIELLGGILNLYWDEKDNHVYMTGPAVKVFDGKLDENIIKEI